MKVKAVVLDLTGTAMNWLDIHGNEEHLELCEILTLDNRSPIPLQDLNNYDNWDILLVFEQGVRDKVRQLLWHIGVPDNRVLYPLDEVEGSLYDNRSLSTYIFDESIGNLLAYISKRKSDEKYAMVSSDDLTYINVSTDNVILPEMLISGRNWAYEDMVLFYKLSNKYFQFENDQIFFCDIGANIGTTSIYFKKKIDRDISIMAFEPSSENYKLLRINALINDIDISKHMFINEGLSDRRENIIISYNSSNPGGSSVIKNIYDIKEEAHLVSFDEYLRENSIDPKSLKYLWIDVEGYEARFLAGARDTLERINIPVFMEFIPRFYMERQDEFDMLMNEMERHFQYFICKEELDNGKQPIGRLRQEQYNKTLSWDLFLLKEG